MDIPNRGLWCVVPAAGRGTRFGGEIPKQYLTLSGKPLLLRTLERLAGQSQIVGLIVVIAADDSRWPGTSSIGGKPVVTTVGGDERADSVLAGLRALPGTVRDDHYVLVHDAARPCVQEDDISRLIDLAPAAGGGLLAAPVRDTLKRADLNDRVVATEPREMRWRALTPQMFRLGELIAALESAREAGISVTDEAMAMERSGQRPLLVTGAESNIKITTPDDLALAEFLLGRGEGRRERGEGESE
jgi:2-C-methyl-D-erythritol 4-phosphate cytidylyltransferase